MALTEIYVDPSIAADSGAGTIGDPYGDLEYAIEQETFDTTNGTRVNIKAGTDEVLAAEISAAMADTSVSVAWAPGLVAPCVFQGYTAAAGDGGIGGISGGSAVAVFDDTAMDHVFFAHLHCHTVGAGSYVIRFDDLCGVYECEINGSDTGGIAGTANCYAVGNYVHDVGINGIASFNQSSLVAYNHIQGANTAISGVSGTILRNIIVCTGSEDGIKSGAGACIISNSVYSAGGTGEGISDATQVISVLLNNVVEGFSGAGGIGFDLDAQNIGVRAYGANSAYNNETNFAGPNDVAFSFGGNETLVASPFTNPAGSDFSPVDTGSIKEGSLPAIIGGGLV